MSLATVAGDRPSTRPEESYRLWCVIGCDLETPMVRQSWPALGCGAREKKNLDKVFRRSLVSDVYTSMFQIILISMLARKPIVMTRFLCGLPHFFVADSGILRNIQKPLSATTSPFQ